MKINDVKDSGSYYLIYTDSLCILQRKGPSTASEDHLNDYEAVICAFCERELEKRYLNKTTWKDLADHSSDLIGSYPDKKPAKYGFHMGTHICAICKHRRKTNLSMILPKSHKNSWCSHDPVPEGIDASHLVSLYCGCGYFEARENVK